MSTKELMLEKTLESPLDCKEIKLINPKGKESESHSVMSDSATPWIVHGILQARILEWVAVLFSRGSSQPRDQTQVSRITGRFFPSWATREAHLIGNQPWIFIRRTDGEAGAPILWPPDVKSHLIRKDPDAGKDWEQEEKGATEDEMVGCHHWLYGHEFEQILGDGDG